MSALPDVLESARGVLQSAAFVSIDEQAVHRWVEAQSAAAFATPSLPEELQFSGSRDDSANLILLLDCLNFCFWSDKPWSVDFRGRPWSRTYAMYASVLRAAEQDAGWLKPGCWASVDPDDVARLFRGRGQIPMLEQRRQVLNETGRCLLESFGGRFVNAVERAGQHARRLAYLLADAFPSFRDAPTYRGRTVAVLKRAQICAADLHQCWTRQGYGGLAGMDALTVFADYRLPQYLRHIQVMGLTSDLAARIDSGRELEAGSDDEVELRAATIVAGDLMVTALGEVGIDLPAWHLDFVLWERSHAADVVVPHHRTRTIYY